MVWHDWMLLFLCNLSRPKCDSHASSFHTGLDQSSSAERQRLDWLNDNLIKHYWLHGYAGTNPGSTGMIFLQSSRYIYMYQPSLGFISLRSVGPLLGRWSHERTSPIFCIRDIWTFIIACRFITKAGASILSVQIVSLTPFRMHEPGVLRCHFFDIYEVSERPCPWPAHLFCGFNMPLSPFSCFMVLLSYCVYEGLVAP